MHKILDNSNHQYDVHQITKPHIYVGWRTWNTNIEKINKEKLEYQA